VEVNVYFVRFGGKAAKTNEKEGTFHSNSFDFAASPQNQTKQIVISLLPRAKKALAA
jgi:hypothetical protein